MNQFLKILDIERKPDEHIVMIMDGAGWHKSKALQLPDGITALLLPPYSPELNPTENLWHYMRSHHLSNRAYQNYDELLDAGTDAYRRLTPEVVMQRRRDYGEQCSRPRGGATVIKIDLDRLRQLVDQQPDATARQLHERLGIKCSVSAVDMALRRMGLSFKKRRCMPRLD